MASQQQPRRWLSLGSFGRSAQQPPPRRPAPTRPTPQPQAIQISAPAPQPTPTTPPKPAAASPAANVTSSQPPAARPPKLSTAQPRPSPPAPAQKSPPALLFPARPRPPTAPELRPSSTTTPPTNSTTRPATALQHQVINKPASPSPSPPSSAASPAALPTAIFANGAHPKVSSPKTISEVSKTMPQTSQVKPMAYPPSQTKSESNHEPKIPIEEVEQKTILQVHETPQKPNTIQKNSICTEQKNQEKTNRSTNQNEKAKDAHEKHFIKLAGESKGAIMELSSPFKNSNNNGWGIHGKKLGADYDSGNEEERSNIIKKSSPPKKLFINSNVQGINNAILFGGSFEQDNDGVRLSFSGKAINGGHGITSRTT